MPFIKNSFCLFSLHIVNLRQKQANRKCRLCQHTTAHKYVLQGKSICAFLQIYANVYKIVARLMSFANLLNP